MVKRSAKGWGEGGKVKEVKRKPVNVKGNAKCERSVESKIVTRLEPSQKKDPKGNATDFQKLNRRMNANTERKREGRTGAKYRA